MKLVVANLVLAALAGAQNSADQPATSKQPTNATSVQTMDTANAASDTAMDPASLLPDLPALPAAKATLIGGTVGSLDRVRDQLVVQVFGGGKVKISFDPRTHVYDNGTEASLSSVHKGDRVYVDTILNGSTVFARSIRLKTAGVTGESQGTIVSYRADKGELVLRDALSPHSLKIRLTPQTQVMQHDHPMQASQLSAGTLVSVKFGPQGRNDVAREITVLAVPGANFTFAGVVASLDMRLGVLVLESSTDHKTYEIAFDPSLTLDADTMRPGTDVTVLTNFDGNRYVARSFTVNSNQR